MSERELHDALEQAEEDDPVSVHVTVAGIDATTILNRDDVQTITGECEYSPHIDLDRDLMGWPTGRVDYWDDGDGGEAPVLAVYDSEADEGPEVVGEIVDWEIV
jgi:hypothetical protein